jgi:hypothetical protein
MPRTEPFPDAMRDLQELRGLADIEASLGREGRLDDVDDAARSRAHDDNPGRQEHSLGDRMRDEDDGLGRLAPELQKLQIEKISDPKLQLMLDAGLGAALPGSVELDVLKAVRDMLSTVEGDLRGTVERLDIASVAVADNRLHIKFDFKLIGE